jgi:hypothetical protein
MKAQEIRRLPDIHGIYETNAGGFAFPEGTEALTVLVLVEIAAQLAEIRDILDEPTGGII